MRSATRVLLACILSAGFQNSSSAQPVSISANSGSMTATSDRYGRLVPDSRGWTDPALEHNKLLQQHTSDGMYKMIGTFKVTGSSYLFGEHNKADMFATEAKAYNIFISYNTYNQEVEFYSTGNPDKALVKEPGEIDSFIIQQNIELGITRNLKFIYGSILGAKDKYYFQEVCTGGRFNLYKRYKSDLGYVTSNYIQSELRQFDLEFEYYFTDNQSKGLKKIKPNAYSVIKEFKEIKDLSTVVNVDDFTANPEAAFCKAFEYLNK
jgi:hypothetical protein